CCTVREGPVRLPRRSSLSQSWEPRNPPPPVMMTFMPGAGWTFAKRSRLMWSALPNMDRPLSGHKIGFVGLGNMGRAMARHLHEAGAKVHVWNRSDAAAEAA